MGSRGSLMSDLKDHPLITKEVYVSLFDEATVMHAITKDGIMYGMKHKTSELCIICVYEEERFSND
jgi:hypothetical protein